MAVNQKAVKVLNKVLEAGFTDEKAISAMTMDDILSMQSITVADIALINDLQKSIYHRQRRHIAPSVIPCVLCTPYRISRHDVRTSACRAPARHAAAHIAVYPVARSSAIVSVIHLRSNLSLSFRRLSKACAVFRAASPNRVRNARARSGFSFQSPSASIKYMPQIKMT